MSARWWVVLSLVLVGATGFNRQTGAGDVGLRIDSATPEAGLVVDYRVQAINQTSGEAVTDADVVMRFVQKDGAESKQTALTGDGSGFYEGSLTFPSAGDWTVRIGVEGGTTIELPQEVPDIPLPDSEKPAEADSSDATDDGSGGLVVAIGIGATVILLAAAAVVLSRRRRPRDAEPIA